MGIKSYISPALLPADVSPHNMDGSGAAYSYYQWKQSGTSSFPVSPRSSLDSQLSTDSHEPYASGKFPSSGIFRPALSAQYNFLLQKMKHRKEYKQEFKEETEMKSMSERRKNRASSSTSRRSSSSVDELKAMRYH